MSTNVNKFVPEIAEKLNYATADIYLLQQGVLTAEEFESFQKALQNGSLSNSGVVRQLLPKILQKPRKFYRALRQHIQDDYNVHPCNKELFHMLPDSFGKGRFHSALGRLRPSQKNKSPISTIAEDSSDTDKKLDQLSVRTSSPTEGHVSTNEEESDYETSTSSTTYSLGPNNRMPSTQSLSIPIKSYSRQLSETSYHQQSTTQVFSHRPARKRSASINENHLAHNMKAHSLSGLYQPNIGSQASTPVPKSRTLPQAAANFVTKLTTTEKHQNGQSDTPTDDSASQASGYANLQQQLDSVKSISDTKHQALENLLKESIDQLQQQLESSLIEKTAKIQSELQQQLEMSNSLKFQAFEESFKESITSLQQQIRELQCGLLGNNQNETDHETFKIQIEAEKQKAAEAKEALAQASAQVQEKAKEIVALKKESQYELQLQSMMQKLKEAKSDYDSKLTEHTNELLKYKNLYDTEKQSNVKAQEDLTQVSTELQGRTQETVALKKERRELQSTIQKLENTLKDFKSGHDSKITEYTKESKEYKNLNDDKNEDTVKTQEAMMQVSAELQDKEKEYLALEQSHNELLYAKQNMEKQLQDVSHQYQLCIKEREDSVKHLQAEKENATKIQSALQNKITTLLQEKENLECVVKSLQDENDTLKTASPLSPIKYKLHVHVPTSRKPSQPGKDKDKLSQIPKMWKVKRDVIPKIMDHWKDVALHSLSYNASEIAKIEKAGADPTHCCTIMFKDWLETNKNVTWEMLFTQLRKVEKLGDEVEEIMKQIK